MILLLGTLSPMGVQVSQFLFVKYCMAAKCYKILHLVPRIDAKNGGRFSSVAFEEVVNIFKREGPSQDDVYSL
jgi:hypothetical protein